MKTKKNGTTNEVSHTPTPWKAGGTMDFFGDQTRRIDDENGLLIALVSDRNLKDVSLRDLDAALIVRAVNEREQLLATVERLKRDNEALLEVAKLANSMIVASKNAGLIKPWDGGFNLERLLTRLQKAIAQAEGRENA